MSNSKLDALASQFNGMDLIYLGKNVTYRPLNNGANDKTIKAIVQGETQTSSFQDGNAVSEFDFLTISISSRNNTEGHVSPTEWVREGQVGDVIIIDSVTWYLKRHLVNGNDAGGFHSLLLVNDGAGLLK